MIGLVYNLSNSKCLNTSDSWVEQLWISSIISIVSIVILVPTLIVQFFFIYRYKSTFLHRQFLYATVVVILLFIINIVLWITVDVGCPFFLLFVYYNSLGVYIAFVEIMQITTIHLLLLYKLCKYIETRTTQRLQTLCCNIRPRPRHDVMIVCIQLGLPLPILIDEIVVILKTHSIFTYMDRVQMYMYIQTSLLAVNILLGLICTMLLVLWFCMLWKRGLLKNKLKFVCTQMGHILLVLVVLLIGNILLLVPSSDYFFEVKSVMQTFLPVSFGVYILMSIPSLKRRVATKA